MGWCNKSVGFGRQQHFYTYILIIEREEHTHHPSHKKLCWKDLSFALLARMSCLGNWFFIGWKGKSERENLQFGLKKAIWTWLYGNVLLLDFVEELFWRYKVVWEKLSFFPNLNRLKIQTFNLNVMGQRK